LKVNLPAKLLDWVFASLLLCMAGLPFLTQSALAHPYPNSLITISVNERLLTLDIRVPAPELLLALTGDAHRDPDAFLKNDRASLIRYLGAHLTVTGAVGAPLPYEIRGIALQSASDPDAGRYREFRLAVEAPVPIGADPRSLSLRYDAVIHQIPNHFALVRIAEDFRAGLAGETEPVELGVIRYDFAARSVPPFALKPAARSLWLGFTAMIGLGVRHVAGGLDHVLFLATLLAVAPLRAQNGHWSLFQGYGFAIRRFLAVSIAFTLGHSASLALGAYHLVSVNAALVETLIAVSILICALHGLRPLFAGREWLVAGGFGLVHGLAFSTSVSALNLPPLDNAVAVFGFNIGVEAAQLLVMAAAMPPLFVSRYPLFHPLRRAAMLLVAALAALWTAQRALGLPLPVFLTV
jgi:HupE / UreJ protein